MPGFINPQSLTLDYPSGFWNDEENNSDSRQPIYYRDERPHLPTCTICKTHPTAPNSLLHPVCTHPICRDCLHWTTSITCVHPHCLTPLYLPASPQTTRDILANLKDDLDDIKGIAHSQPSSIFVIEVSFATQALHSIWSLVADQLLSDADAESSVYDALVECLQDLDFGNGYFLAKPVEWKGHLEAIVKNFVLEDLKTVYPVELADAGLRFGASDAEILVAGMRIERVRGEVEVWREVVGLLVDVCVWRDLGGEEGA